MTGYTCVPELSSRVWLDEKRYIHACRGVYEPAEDTWLLAEVGVEEAHGLRPRLIVDVGTGTGAVYAYIASRLAAYGVLIDVNPCAARCARLNAEHLGVVADVAQCDSITCIRVPPGTLVVYNTPYLPVEDEGLEGLAWSGGAREAVRLVRLLAGWRGWRALVTIAETSPLQALLEEAERLGLCVKIVREAPEDLFNRVYVVRITPCRASSRRRR